jgi:hypothetical protein
MMKFFPVILLFTSWLAASPVTITLSGQFSSSASNNTYFAPNGIFTVSLQVTNPPPVITSASDFFQTTYSASSYTLNGNPVALSGNMAFFYTTESISFCLSDTCLYKLSSETGSPALFSGPTASPTFVPGPYQTNQWFTSVSNVGDGGSPNGGPITVTAGVAAVPEPAAWLLTLTGVLIVVVRRRMRLRLG